MSLLRREALTISNPSISLKYLLIFLLLASLAGVGGFPLVSHASESKGAGFVLLTTLLRNKSDLSSSAVQFICPDTFYARKNAHGGKDHDIYSIEILNDQLNIFTKTGPNGSCSNEDLEIIEKRHPCLAEILNQSIQQGIELSEDLHGAYEKLQQEGIYLGNVDPQKIRYRIVISSTDKSLSYIDMDAWDFSWLTSWIPTGSQENCPFSIRLVQELKRPLESPKLIKTYPLWNNSDQRFDQK